MLLRLIYAKRLEDRLKDLPLVWVSISLDTHVDTWKKFVKQKDMDGEQLLCSRAYKHPLMQQMAVHGIPRFIILDPGQEKYGMPLLVGLPIRCWESCY